MNVPKLAALLEKPPPLWPKFTSPLRSTALTARLGRMVGICFTICFVTGMLSHYQYYPWHWLPEPASPVWAYRITQGFHVATGIATIPLLLVKLWSVFPKLFTWPPAKSLLGGLERLSVAILVSSALVELFTGLFNSMNYYPWPWSFVPVHRFLAYVVFGSVLLHVAVKLPDIKYGLATKVAAGDVLTEVPWEDNPDAYSNNDDTHVPPPETTGISRRGVLVATGAGVGVVVATTVGQTVTPLEPIGLFAIRKPKDGPQGVPINRLAYQAKIASKSSIDETWSLEVRGRNGFELSMDEVLEMAVHEASLPIACVEGWSVGAHWKGLRLKDIVERAGGDDHSRVRVDSLEKRGSYRTSYVDAPQVRHALLATHLNGERLALDHGYPLRLISPNRAGVLNTKWLYRVEVL